MTELLPFLKEMITAPGVSGYEAPIRKIIEETWQPLVDELSVSRLGSLHALRRGQGEGPRPGILIATHMDAIGLIVTGVKDGFIRLSKLGGIDARVLPGQAVTVHGREDLPGVIVQPPGHTLPPDAQIGPVPLNYLLVDVGLSPRQVSRKVRVGDPISFAQEPLEMNTEFLAGHTLDNRVSVAALTLCLQELQNRTHAWDLWAVATTQEEETLGGALTSAYDLRPKLAVAVDVTFGASPGSPGHLTFKLGKGPTLGWGPNVHPGLYKAFKDLADRLEIPYHLEAMPGSSGTDAIKLQIAAEGIPTMVIGLPLRYMHTPVEMVSIKDVKRVGRLLAEFVSRLEEDFMDTLAWEEKS